MADPATTMLTIDYVMSKRGVTAICGAWYESLGSQIQNQSMSHTGAERRESVSLGSFVAAVKASLVVTSDSTAIDAHNRAWRMAPARHCGLNCCQTFFATECERIGNTKLKRDVPQQGILGPRRSCVFIRHQSQPTGSAWQPRISSICGRCTDYQTLNDRPGVCTAASNCPDNCQVKHSRLPRGRALSFPGRPAVSRRGACGARAVRVPSRRDRLGNAGRCR